ncbi:hypothetical protein SARC_00822 [Sphaeroforma arctica JP610]|uniref:Uncharacterized protein n=1 Tax=Sphaeroforma arctica JP610 TaxID=667725 RepID=A0A0L0GFN8_9EUKA|nr:hypothetical protein SARC_00822 [Sphaeroforma arctica JP610]KNC87078.1 hypothetical protein SARC_00822 [Sphaeroforma arctica JP610]|eukprot:XP_014160980.1 hypothetical protein SARC_00822 [Sphaeroforma arctica JP610]
MISNASAQFQLDCSQKTIATLVAERKFLIKRLKDKLADDRAAEEAHIKTVNECENRRRGERLIQKRAATRRSGDQVSSNSRGKVKRKPRSTGPSAQSRQRRKAEPVEPTSAPSAKKVRLTAKRKSMDKNVASDIMCDEEVDFGEDDPDLYER